MKKSKRLMSLLLAMGMLLGACDKAEKTVTPAENGGNADNGGQNDNPGGNEGGGEHQHTFGAWQETPATCAAEGKKERVCSGCGEKETEVLPKLDTHTFGEWQVTAATCAADGFQKRVCSVCGKEETEVLTKTGEHNYVDAADQTGAVAPTCAEDGVVITECSVCGAKSTRVAPKTGEHDWTEWDITQPATYDEEGAKERTCKVCSLKEEVVIEKKVPAWNAEQQAIIDEHFYGIPVPYIREFDEGELEYDPDQDEAILNLDESSAELLAKYVAAFDETWLDNSSVNASRAVYRFEKAVETEDGVRMYGVVFYGMAQTDSGWAITPDGSGIFVLEILLMPHAYDFAESYANMVGVSMFGSTLQIPAMPAIFFEYDSSELGNGLFYVFGYVEAPGDGIWDYWQAYARALMTAGFKYVDDNANGWPIFIADDNEISITLLALSAYSMLAMIIEDLPGIPVVEGDVLNATALQLDAEDTSFKNYTYTGTSGAEYLAVASSEKAIKFTKNSNAGLVVTKPAGLATGVGVLFNEDTAAERGIRIYGSNNAFDVADMYDEDNAKGLVELGEIIVGEDGKLEFNLFFDTPYAYIGIRPIAGNVYIDQLVIGWEAPAPADPGDPADPADPEEPQDPSDPQDGE